VPVLRPIAGFIFLTSIPGALIMGILRFTRSAYSRAWCTCLG
jgi:uncharacterized membrane protein